MLFRTVYGPELEAILSYCRASYTNGKSVDRNDVRRTFLMDPDEVSTQSVDDAIAFLLSAGLLIQRDTLLEPAATDNSPFALNVLSACRKIAQEQSALNSLYSIIIDEIFIKPNRLFVEDMHSAVNNIEVVQELGGISKEKVQSWKRVMEFLGVGYRAFGGFICAYSPELVLSIVNHWHTNNGTLQSLFEEHFDSYLPHMSQDGTLAHAVSRALLFLAERNEISLYPLQDSPARTYLNGLRGIRRRVRADDQTT